MNILVSAYLDKNIGDDLMIKVLTKNLSSHQIHLICSDRNLFVPFEKLNNIRMVQPPTSFFKKLEFYKRYDLYIKIGGSIFTFNSKVNTIKRIFNLSDLILLRLLGINIAIIGCNFENFRVKIGKIITKFELSMASLITVRDKESSRFMQSNRLKYYPDIVFSYDLTNIRADHSIKRIGISVYRSVTNTSLNYEYYKKMTEIADEYIRRTNGRVSLFAFDSENENDTSAIFNILRQSRFKENIDVFIYTGDERGIIENIVSCEALIATRFHSAIIALKHKIPILPIIYSNKMNNLLDDINYMGDRYYFNDIGKIDAKGLVHKLGTLKHLNNIDGAFGHITEIRNLLDKIKSKKRNSTNMIEKAKSMAVTINNK